MNHQGPDPLYDEWPFHQRCCRFQPKLRFPLGCNKDIRDSEIATKSSRAVMDIMTDKPQSVAPRAEPMVFVLTSRERKPKWERARMKGIQKRRRDKLDRSSDRVGRSRRRYFVEDDSEESSEEERIESDGEESSEEEHIA